MEVNHLLMVEDPWVAPIAVVALVAAVTLWDVPCSHYHQVPLKGT